MFPNLNAEQARKNFTNTEVANKLGLSRNSYERKKNNGRFLMSECMMLCKLFERDFEYLFETTT